MKTIIRPYMSIYQSSPRPIKTVLTRQVVQAIRDNSNLSKTNGQKRGERVRFLKQDYKKGGIPSWIEASEDEIFAKVSHCLRMKVIIGKRNSTSNIPIATKSKSWTGRLKHSPPTGKQEGKERAQPGPVAVAKPEGVLGSRASSWPSRKTVFSLGNHPDGGSSSSSSASSCVPDRASISSSSSLGDIDQGGNDHGLQLQNPSGMERVPEEIEEAATTTTDFLAAWNPGSRPPSPSVFD